MSHILLIDNYDSFTYNLVQAFRILGAKVDVVRNDVIEADKILATGLTHLVISPGPGRPSAAGISIEAIRACAGKVPVLGVCLGHQAIVEAFGGRVDSAHTLMHGKSSPVNHDGKGVFAGLEQPLEAGRYHSLAAVELPDELEVSATTEDKEIMGIRHRSLCIEGVQFHPESILTPQGDRLLANFLELEIVRD